MPKPARDYKEKDDRSPTQVGFKFLLLPPPGHEAIGYCSLEREEASWPL
jgi:hypothetical protein